jgi:hypothetical protein
MIGQVSAAVIRLLNRIGLDFQFRLKRTMTSYALETHLSIMGERNRNT